MKKIIILFFSLWILQGCVSQATFGDAIVEGEPSPFPTSVVPTRPIYDVERGNIINQSTYSGRISAINSAPLQFSIDGRILESYFSTGEDVVAGDILAQLDTAVLENQLLDAEEELAIAQALLDSAESQIDFARRRSELEIELAQLFLDSAILNEDTLLIRQREIELELEQLNLDQLDSGVDPALSFDVIRAQEEVDAINEQISQATLLAPMDGRLIVFPVSNGDSITAFEQIGTVADISQLEVTDSIDDDGLSELSEMMPAVLQRSNAPDRTYDAIITNLPPPFGTGSDEQVHVQFVVAEEASDFALGDRMTFTVTIDEREDVLWLPAGAIRQFSGRNFVVVQDNGVERRIDVQLGLEGNDRVEILEGLEEGQRVIAP